MEAVESLDEAKKQVEMLGKIDEHYLDENTSARWSIEYCERYQSLQNGLENLYDDGVLETEPGDVLVEIGKTNYSEAAELLEAEAEIQDEERRTTVF